MYIVEIEALGNGAHRAQSWRIATPPEGWAVLTDDMIPAHFPFFTIDDMEDGIVTALTDGSYPAPAAIPPKQLRENAYNSDAVIAYDGENLTVTEAAQLWQYYAAEGSGKAAELQTLIAAAKENIRAQFPDNE